VSEPMFFVVERCARGEFPAIIRDRLPERLTAKGSTLLVYACRLDKLPDGERLAGLRLLDLYRLYQRHKAAGTLPNNLADPPQKVTGGQKGMERGPETWWKPTPLPRGQDWTP
jgi:hypothetical protein